MLTASHNVSQWELCGYMNVGVLATSEAQRVRNMNQIIGRIGKRSLLASAVMHYQITTHGIVRVNHLVRATYEQQHTVHQP